MRKCAWIILVLFSGVKSQDVYITDTIWVNAYRYGYSLICEYPSSNIISIDKLYDESIRDIIDLVAKEGNILAGRNTYTGSGGFPQIRGRNGSVLFDGFLLDMPQLGGFDLGWIPQVGLSSAELIKGPASIFYGNDAIGGALNLLPPWLVNDTIESSIYFERGELKYKRTKGTVLTKFSKRLRYKVDLVEFGSDGARENENFSSTDFSAALSVDLLDSAKNELKLHLYGLRHKGTLQIPSQSPFIAEASKDNSELTLAELSAHYAHKRTKIANFKLFLNKIDQRYLSPFGSSLHKNTVFATRTEIFLDLPPIGKINLNINYDYAKVKSTDIGQHEKNRYSLLIVDKLNIAKHTSLLTALRLEKPYTDKVVFVPMKGIKFEKGETFFYGNIRLGFRAPTLNDLYWPYQAYDYDSDGNPDYINEGNLALASEVNWGSEIGAGIKKVGYITLFYSRAKNLIEWRNVNPSLTYGYWKPVNIENWSEFKGAEIVASWSLRWLYFSSKLTLLDALSPEKKRLPYRPALLFDTSFNLKNDFLRGDGSFECGINGRVWSKLKDERGNELDSPLLLDCRIKVSYLKASIFATVENILDKQYSLRSDFPQPKRTFRGGFSINFAY